MHSNRKTTSPSVAVGRPEHVLAVIDHGGVVTLVGNHSVVTRIMVRRPAVPEDTDVQENPGWNLVSVTGHAEADLAHGTFAEMIDMRQRLSNELSAHLKRGKGGHRVLLMTIAGLVGLFVGATGVVGLMPVPSQVPPTLVQMPPQIPPQMLARMRGEASPQTVLPDLAPAIPLPQAPVRATLPSLEDVSPSAGQHSSVSGSRIPVADVSVGEASRPRAPVSLDDDPAAATGEGPATPPAARPGSQPTPPSASRLPSDKATDLRTLDALTKLKEAIRTNGKISAETLGNLPPDIAARIRSIPSNRKLDEHLSPEAIDAGGHDKFGIPNLPDRMSWVGLEGPHVPLPGGGDIKSPADMKRFDMAP